VFVKAAVRDADADFVQIGCTVEHVQRGFVDFVAEKLLRK